MSLKAKFLAALRANLVDEFLTRIILRHITIDALSAEFVEQIVGLGLMLAAHHGQRLHAVEVGLRNTQCEAIRHVGTQAISAFIFALEHDAVAMNHGEAVVIIRAKEAALAAVFVVIEVVEVLRYAIVARASREDIR